MTGWPHPLLIHPARIPDTILRVRRHDHRLEVLDVHHPGTAPTVAQEDALLQRALGGDGAPAPDEVTGLRTLRDNTDPDLRAILIPGGAVRVSANGNLNPDGGGWARLDLAELGRRCVLFFIIPDATTLPAGQDPDPGIATVQDGLHWHLADRDRWLDWMGLEPARQ